MTKPEVPASLTTTLGALSASGWKSVPVKEELRTNAVRNISEGKPLFEGVMGYEDTVMPQLENALLAGHDVVFLGERGQAKTRMIRSLTNLLDDSLFVFVMGILTFTFEPRALSFKACVFISAKSSENTSSEIGSPSIT